MLYDLSKCFITDLDLYKCCGLVWEGVKRIGTIFWEIVLKRGGVKPEPFFSSLKFGQWTWAQGDVGWLVGPATKFFYRKNIPSKGPLLHLYSILFSKDVPIFAIPICFCCFKIFVRPSYLLFLILIDFYTPFPPQ